MQSEIGDLALGSGDWHFADRHQGSEEVGPRFGTPRGHRQEETSWTPPVHAPALSPCGVTLSIVALPNEAAGFLVAG